MSKLPCSPTRNMTSHSKENLVFHSLPRWKMIIIQILATSLMHFLFKRLGECTFWMYLLFRFEMRHLFLYFFPYAFPNFFTQIGRPLAYGVRIFSKASATDKTPALPRTHSPFVSSSSSLSLLLFCIFASRENVGMPGNPCVILCMLIPEFQVELCKELLTAAKGGDEEEVKKLLAEGANMDYQNEVGVRSSHVWFSLRDGSITISLPSSKSAFSQWELVV